MTEPIHCKAIKLDAGPRHLRLTIPDRPVDQCPLCQSHEEGPVVYEAQIGGATIRVTIELVRKDKAE